MKIDFPPLDYKSDRWRLLQIHGWNMGHQILKNSNMVVGSNSLSKKKNRWLIVILSAKCRQFFGLVLRFLHVCLHSRFISDLSVLHRYFANISAILPIFLRYSRESIIDGDYRFDDDRYPIFPDFSIHAQSKWFIGLTTGLGSLWPV